MAISVADNFSYKGAKPLDARLTYSTVAEMKTAVENTLYDGCMAYVKATQKYYTFDSSNETDVTLGRWRELETGTSITIDETPTEGSTNAVSSGGTFTALDDKVDKVSGKGLSTEDYTTAEKTKLSGIDANAEENTIESITVNGDEVTPDANKNIALTIITNTVNNLLNYYLKSETYSKTEVDSLISAVQGASFESVQTLPTTDIKTNVIYLVPKQDPEVGNVKDEYINLDGTTAGWEHIGDTSVDLSGYVTTQALNTALADYTTTADLTTLLSGKVDKVAGKGLSTNDYTTEEKNKLAGLSNYDDTALSGRVSDIEDVVPSTASSSNKLATQSDVAGATGHKIQDDSGVQMTDRAALQFKGATVTDDSEGNRTIVEVDEDTTKADKVSNATNGNFAGLDANGNLTDSGKKPSDFLTEHQNITGKADKVANATNGHFAGLDTSGNITDSGIAPSDKENKFRYTTMPTASADNVGQIIQYIGETTATYTKNTSYECKAQGTDPETYAWEEVKGAAVKDDRITDEITQIDVQYDDTRKYKFVPYISVNVLEMVKQGKISATDAFVYMADMYLKNEISAAEVKMLWDAKAEEISFSDCSLETIVMMADMYYKGTIAQADINRGWNIGDGMSMSIAATSATAAQDVTLKIADFSHDTLTTAQGGKTKALMTLGFMLAENKGFSIPYYSSTLRTWLEGDFYNDALPDVIKPSIKTVTKTLDNGVNGVGTGATPNNASANVKIFLPSAFELAGGDTTGNYYAFSCSGQTGRYEGHKSATFRSKQVVAASSVGWYSGAPTWYVQQILVNANHSESRVGSGTASGIMPHFCI